MDYQTRAREVFDIELDGLGKVRDALDESFGRVIELILAAVNAGGKVVVSGLGKNHHVGQKIAATFTSTGTPAVTLHPAEAMHGDLGILHKGDLLLALSFSGESEELVGLIPIARRVGVKVVAMSQNRDNALAELSDEVLVMPIDREACPFNMAPTTSTTATLALGDALAIVLLEARGFNREDYAKLHPGGAIGRTLLLRVADIMRTGERLAKVSSQAKVKDALLAMTTARSGAAAIVDEAGKLLGVFTDGDLRRHITDPDNLAERPVSEVMTADPIAVKEDQLAVDVLQIFETHNIDDLVVIDADRRVVGLVDIQDLPKLKIL